VRPAPVSVSLWSWADGELGSDPACEEAGGGAWTLRFFVEEVMALGRWVRLLVVVVAVGGEVEVLFELGFRVDERVDTILLSTVTL